MNICNTVSPETIYFSDIVRYLMYYNRYGDRDRTRDLFAQIHGNERNKLLTMISRCAEDRCPQHLPIGKIATEAVTKLA